MFYACLLYTSVFGIQGISAAISFGDNNGRAIETDMANNNALRESAGLRILRIDGLGDRCV